MLHIMRLHRSRVADKREVHQLQRGRLALAQRRAARVHRPLAPRPAQLGDHPATPAHGSSQHQGRLWQLSASIGHS